MGIFNKLFGKWVIREFIALRDKDGHTRLDAVIELGKKKDARAVEALIVALKDKEDYVRWNAAEALGKIGDEIAIDPLIKALKDKNVLVQKDAAKALRRFVNKKASDAIENHENSRGQKNDERQVESERIVKPFL